MNNLHLTDNATNPLLTRSPICLATVSNRIIPPSFQDEAICGFIAATNIEYISNGWSCTTDGIPMTDPCSGAGFWDGIMCNGYAVSDLHFSGYGLIGMIMLNV